MSQIPVTVKIDAKLKHEAQRLAKSMGLSLSAIVENKLKEVIRERRVVFEEELVPNKKTARQLEQIEADIKAGKNISPVFDSVDDMFTHLKKTA